MNGNEFFTFIEIKVFDVCSIIFIIISIVVLLLKKNKHCRRHQNDLYPQ